MSPALADILAEGRLAARALVEFGQHLLDPTVRLGVTGLSRSGKTVFITALVHGLVQGGRFPVLEPLATGRIARARLAPQPDDAVPRFDYEGNLRALIEERRWPESTDRISELRLVIDYQSQRGAARTLTIDIVDYPGEWLLDLPLLGKSYQQWSAESLALAAHGPRAQVAAPWREYLASLDPLAPQDEQAALRAAALFTAYLKACRDERYAMSLLPPGRFLMPGDLAGSPALTFSPLQWPRADRASSQPRGLARRHDAAAVRGLQGRGGAAVLREAISPASTGRSCWSMRSPPSMPDLRRCAISRARSPPCWNASAWASEPGRARCCARASTASCSPPPRPTICTTPATSGWRRSWRA